MCEDPVWKPLSVCGRVAEGCQRSGSLLEARGGLARDVLDGGSASSLRSSSPGHLELASARHLLGGFIYRYDPQSRPKPPNHDPWSYSVLGVGTALRLLVRFGSPAGSDFQAPRRAFQWLCGFLQIPDALWCLVRGGACGAAPAVRNGSRPHGGRRGSVASLYHRLAVYVQRRALPLAMRPCQRSAGAVTGQVSKPTGSSRNVPAHWHLPCRGLP